ncbi:MAG: SH3 domain-containing protein [bacterium]|nr:SH3 domain-containing protein [bacterium]
MKFFKIITAFLIIIVSLHVYEPVLCKDSNKKKYIKLMVVNAKSGLRMRKGPGTKYKKFLVIPRNALISITRIDQKKIKIMNIEGKWYKTKWKGKPGWVFSGFLKETPPWLKNIQNFWITKDSNGESATAFSNIAAGGDGTSMGCPGGFAPFKVEESLLVGKEIKLKVVDEPLYPDDIESRSNMTIKYISKKIIHINNSVYKKSKFSECSK